MLNFYLYFALSLLLCGVSSEKAPKNAPIIDRPETWCTHGAVTATTVINQEKID